MSTPSLFGIKNSNKDLTSVNSWGKNQFNNSFPVALACYMRSKNNKAVYIKLDSKLETNHSEISIGDIFNTTSNCDDLFFEFEAKYTPFSKFVSDDLESIDLVVKDNKTKKYLRPIEIKLTTLPDNSTCRYSDDKFGTELVVRDKTTRYIALSMAESCESKFQEVHKIFSPVCKHIRHWENAHEIKTFLPDLLNSLDNFLSKYESIQRPLLMQPIWKTVGKSSVLADNCLDIFVWTDFSLTKLFMDSAKSSTSPGIIRQQRAAIRLARFLYEVSSGKPVFQKPIYDEMTYDTLNDKEFSITGNKTNLYMKSKRLTKPIIKKDELKNIILHGGEEWLSPERRFDAIIYYSKELF